MFFFYRNRVKLQNIFDLCVYLLLVNYIIQSQVIYYVQRGCNEIALMIYFDDKLT